MDGKPPTNQELNLYKALAELSDLFQKDATLKQIGLQNHLNEYHLTNVPHIAKYLLGEGIVKASDKGTRKYPLIYYDLERRPSPRFAREILEAVQREAKAYREKAKGKKFEFNTKEEVNTQKKAEEIREAYDSAKDGNQLTEQRKRDIKLEVCHDMMVEAENQKEEAAKALQEAQKRLDQAEAVLEYLFNFKIK